MFKPHYRKPLIIILLLTFILGLYAPALAEQSVTDQIRMLIHRYYVDPVPPAVDQAGSVDEILDKLGDPYAQYFTVQEFKQFQDALDQTFVGIGITYECRDQGAVIKSVIQQSPAESAGLLPGDVITAVDGQALANSSEAEVASLIQGAEGTLVHLSVSHQGKSREFQIERRQIEIPSVEARVTGNHIGYINISAFASDTSERFGEAVLALRKQGALSFIIDLRDDGGGYLDTARNIAGYFISEQTCLLCDDKESQGNPLAAIPQDFTIKAPTVILVNQRTASASEILTGALQDYGLATVIGTRTYGKGCVQWLFDLGDNGVFKLTCEDYRTPRGREVNHIGITPDLATSSDSLKMAELLLSGQGKNPRTTKLQTVKLKGKSYQIDSTLANSSPYRAAYQELMRLTSTPSNQVAVSGASRG